MSDMPAPPALPLRRGGMRRAAGESGVIKTNDDAQATKLSCASMGYFTDAVLPLLHKSLPSRKSPIINRGTWARHAVFRQITHDFITACTQNSTAPALGSTPTVAAVVDAVGASTNGNDSQCISSEAGSSGSSRWEQPICQVVALGAGTDSSWFNLQHQAWELLPAAHFVEMDFQEVVSKKARTVLSTPQLLRLLPDGTTAATAPLVAGTQPAATQSLPQPPLQPAAAAVGAMQPSMQVPADAAAAAGAAGAGGTAGLFSLPHTLGSNNHSSSHPQVAATWTKQQAQSASSNSSSRPASIPNQHQHQQQQPYSSGACSASSTHHSGPQPPAAVLQHVQELTGQQYSLVAADLRDMQQFKAALARAGFNARLPTLYLCECVLIYLEPSEAEAVLSTAAAMAADAGAPAAVAIYEQTRPDDAFGSTMISNLEARGCPLRSVTSVPTPASQAQRLQSNGWTAAAAADMAAIYYGGGSNRGNHSSSRAAFVPGSMQAGASLVPAAGGSAPPSAATGGGGGGGASSSGVQGGSSSGWLRPEWQAERRRIEGLEMLDELEEWKLLQEHYCVAVGVLGDGPSGWLSETLQLQQLAALTT